MISAMVLLRRCCCCFSLRRGTITLGVMGFTGALTAIITLIIAFIFVEAVATFIIDLMGHMYDIPAATGTKHLPKEDQDKEVEKLHKFLVNAYSGIIFILALIGNIIGCIFSGLMVYGAVKRRRNFILPWLTLGILVVIGATVCVILSMIFLTVFYAIIFLLVGLFQIMVMIYFWLIVVSYYQYLRERDRMTLNAPVEMKTRLTSSM